MYLFIYYLYITCLCLIFFKHNIVIFSHKGSPGHCATVLLLFYDRIKHGQSYCFVYTFLNSGADGILLLHLCPLLFILLLLVVVLLIIINSSSIIKC